MQKITRTITAIEATVVVIDKDTLETRETKVLVPKDTEKEIMKAAAIAEPNATPVKIVGVKKINRKYAMTVETFIANSTLIEQIEE